MSFRPSSPFPGGFSIRWDISYIFLGRFSVRSATGSTGNLARKRGAPIFEPVYYDSRRKKCDQGHVGRIGKFTKLCAACLEEHWAKGN